MLNGAKEAAQELLAIKADPRAKLTSEDREEIRDNLAKLEELLDPFKSL